MDEMMMMMTVSKKSAILVDRSRLGCYPNLLLSYACRERLHVWSSLLTDERSICYNAIYFDHVLRWTALRLDSVLYITYKPDILKIDGSLYDDVESSERILHQLLKLELLLWGLLHKL